jgi:hypothetical protein
MSSRAGYKFLRNDLIAVEISGNGASGDQWEPCLGQSIFRIRFPWIFCRRPLKELGNNQRRTVWFVFVLSSLIAPGKGDVSKYEVAIDLGADGFCTVLSREEGINSYN